MTKLRDRRIAGSAVLGVLLGLIVMTLGVAALADANLVEAGTGICPQGSGWPAEHLEVGDPYSGAWGGAISADDGVDVSVNTGYLAYVCVKAGPGYEIWQVTSPGGFVPSVDQKELSHWSLRWEEVPVTTTTTTEDTTTTTEDTTTSTTQETTTTTAGETTTTTTEGTTTSTTVGTTTSTTEGTTTTTTTVDETTTTTAVSNTTVPESTSTTVTPEVSSTTIAQSSTTSETPETLPFTGTGSDDLALVAVLALAAGSGLVLLTPKARKRRGAHLA